MTENQKGHIILDSITVDCVVFGFENQTLKVLLIKHGTGEKEGRWAIPGGWIYKDEDIDNAANRILEWHTGVRDLYLEQLKAFGGVDRFPHDRVITIAYYALIKTQDIKINIGDQVEDAQWWTLHDVPDLIYDHNEILQFAYGRLQHKIRTEPVGFNLLPEKFTLLELQKLYENILGCTLDKPNFRRKIKKMGLLKPSDEMQKGVNHRAARLYHFDENVYNELKEQGFTWIF